MLAKAEMDEGDRKIPVGDGQRREWINGGGFFDGQSDWEEITLCTLY